MRNPSDRPLGAARAQLHETYIVAETRDSVVIVDQHAAHERLVYERMKAMLAEWRRRAAGPADPRGRRTRCGRGRSSCRAAPALARLGLGSEPFGAGAILVREVPALLGEGDIKALVARPCARGRRRGHGPHPAGTSGRHLLAHRLPRQRARRPPPHARGDERAAARDGSDAALRPVQPRPPDLRRAEARRHRAAVRAPLTRTIDPAARWLGGGRAGPADRMISTPTTTAAMAGRCRPLHGHRPQDTGRGCSLLERSVWQPG